MPCSVEVSATTNTSCIELGNSVVGASLLLMAIISVISNTVVLVLVAMNRKLHSTFFCMVINLTIADLFTGLFNMPLYATEMMIGHWSEWDKLCEFVVFADYVPVLASLFSTVAIAASRYDTLSGSSKQRVLSKCQKNLIGVVLVWTLAVAIWLATLQQPRPVQIHGTSRCMAHPSENKSFAIFTTVVAHHLPSLIVVYFNSIILVYVRMLIVRRAELASSDIGSQASGYAQSDPEYSDEPGMAQRMSDAVRRSLGLESFTVPEALWLAPITVMLTSTPPDGDGGSSREMKVVQALGSILTVHVALWLPATIAFDVAIAHRSASSFNMLRFLAYANATANPFLYAFSSEDFQRVYRETMGPRPRDRAVANALVAVKKLNKRKPTRRKVEEANSREHGVDPVNYPEDHTPPRTPEEKEKLEEGVAVDPMAASTIPKLASKLQTPLTASHGSFRPPQLTGWLKKTLAPPQQAVLEMDGESAQEQDGLSIAQSPAFRITRL